MAEKTYNAETLATPVASSTPDVYALRQPRVAARYEILGLLGTGGMGAVYRVRDLELGEVVALKMLRPELMNDEAALTRFRDEVRLARRVTHRNVARTFDIGEHEGAKYLTMEIVDGTSLASLIGERGALPVNDAVEIAEAICEGLAAAHRAAVVHRDLKPENVLIARDGRVVVTDFGIAHAHDAGKVATAIVGTPAYMAPEQLDPHAGVDHRADLYALGAVLYDMLTGERAWKGDAPMEVLSARLAKRAPPDPRVVRANVPTALAAVVMRCMEPRPEGRFASAEEVARALRGTADAAAANVPSRRPAPRPTASGKTVAVLPFRNDGPPEDDYVATGLTDDLIDTLSMTRGLLVKPRGVVERFRGVRAAPQELGRELGVQVIVEGSIRRTSNGLRIGVRAIGSSDEFQLWARRFDASMNDLLVVSDQAAHAIAEALTTELPDLERRVEADPAAVELYLRGRALYWQMWGNSAAPAADLFERALSLAPTDAKLVAAAAMARVRMLFLNEGPREEIVARARELTERAVAMAPELGDAWAALASFRLNTSDALGAAHTLRAGLEHAPNAAMLQDMLGRLLLEAGALDEAMVRLQIAINIDPTLLSARHDLSRAYGFRGEWDLADEQFDAMAQGLAAADLARTRLALWRGKPPKLAAPPPAGSFAELYLEVARTKVLTEEQRAFVLHRSNAAAARLRPLFFQRSAEVFAFVHDLDAAIASTRAAIDSDLIDLAWMDLCPLLAPLRADPRWGPLRAVVAERAAALLAVIRG